MPPTSLTQEVVSLYQQAPSAGSSPPALDGRRRVPQGPARLFELLERSEASAAELQAVLARLRPADVFLPRGETTALVQAMVTDRHPRQRHAMLVMLLRYAMAASAPRALAWLQTTGQTGYSPLCAASLRGDVACVALLLECGAHPDTQDHLGNTALLLAANDLEVVSQLLAAGATDSPNIKGWTAERCAQRAEGDARVLLLLRGCKQTTEKTRIAAETQVVAERNWLDSQAHLFQESHSPLSPQPVLKLKRPEERVPSAKAVAVRASPQARAEMVAAAGQPKAGKRVGTEASGRRKKRKSKSAGPLEFSAADAAVVARSYRFQFGRVPREVLFRDVAQPAVQRYEALRWRLRECTDPSQIGLQYFPDFLSRGETEAIQRHVAAVPAWEQRVGAKGRLVEGTARMNYGVELGKNYKVKRRTALPALFSALGDRVIQFCKERAAGWKTACTAITEADEFAQVYLQRYSEGQTLGFHYDGRKEFGEMICGLSVCGDGMLLMSNTGGTEAVHPGQRDWPNVMAVKLEPGSLYVMTGMARFDLRHAVVTEGQQERISVTFRSLPGGERRDCS